MGDSKLIRKKDGSMLNVITFTGEIVLNVIDERDSDSELDISDIAPDVEDGIKVGLSAFYDVARVEVK
jgi:hypothetical protein